MVTRQRKKEKDKPGKVVWRISAAAPLGEYVRAEPAEPAETPAEAKADKAAAGPREITERGWHHSTHELVHGMDVSEEPLDTLPDDLFDEFVRKDP